MNSIQIQVESPSKTHRKLSVKIPADLVGERIQKTLNEVQKTAKVKGFRPGHVPPNVVKQMYGDEIRSQVLRDLIDDSVQKGVRENKIRAVSRPVIDSGESCGHDHGHDDHGHAHAHNHFPTLQEGKDLTFTATLEVLPEIEAKGYTGLTLTKPSSTVDEKEMKELLEKQRENHAELTPVEDPATYGAKKGDFCDLKFDGKVKMEAGFEARPGMSGTRLVEIGAGDLIPGFEDNLIGMKAGETKTFPIKFPKDYGEAELSEKDAEFTVTTNEIKKKKLPELNDEFAKLVGFETIAAFREKAKEQLTKNKIEESETGLKSSLLQALIDKNEFEVPPSLIMSRTRELAQELSENLKQQRYPANLIEQFLRSEIENLKKRAENQIRSGLILDSISKKENIQSDSKDYETEVARMADEMKMDRKEIEEYYVKNPEARENLMFRLTEEKTVKFLYGKSKIKEA